MTEYGFSGKLANNDSSPWATDSIYLGPFQTFQISKDLKYNLKTYFSNVKKTPFPTICQSEKKCATSAYCAKLTLMKNYRIGLKIKCCRKASGWTQQSNNNNHYNNPVFYEGFGCSKLGPVIAFHSLVWHAQTKVEFRLAIQ